MKVFSGVVGAAMASYAGAVQKVDADVAKMDEDEKAIAELEAQLAAAEARVKAAEDRYSLVVRQMEEKDKPAKPTKEQVPVGPGPGLAEVEAKVPSDDIEPASKGASGAKNTSALTDKQVSSQKWMAKKAAEGRVRDKAKKARDQLRRNARGKRMQYDQGPEDEQAPAPVPEKPAVAKEAERSPLWESDEIKQGAKTLSERLSSLKDLTNAAEKKAAAAKVLMGGRENYYTSEPKDVLSDLEKRGLVDTSLAGELRGLLAGVSEKGAPLAPEEWLDQAKKMSGVERKDAQPYTEGEQQYLKWVDKHGFIAAEAELDAAEARLEELLRQVDAQIPRDVEEDAEPKQAVPADQQIDEEYAEYLEEYYEAERQSKGLKNASALPDKILSKEKWLSARAVDKKEFVNEKKAREARRGEARDMKAGAGDVK